MKSRSISKLKLGIGVGAACIMLMAAAGIGAWLHAKNNTPPPAVSCMHYGTGLYVWPDSIQAFADESYGVVVGTILNDRVPGMADSENSEPIRLRVTDVIKGSVLHKDDVLQLCSSTGPIEFTNDNHNVLVFLEGKDHGTWLTNRSGEGVIPQSKDGRFKQKWSNGSKTSATVYELKKQIK